MLTESENAGISLIRVTTGDGTVTRCRIVGELDCSTADEMFAAVTSALDCHAGVLRLDLDELRFCDAAGVTALLRVQAYATEHGTELVLSGARGGVRRVFDIVELERLVRVT